MVLQNSEIPFYDLVVQNIDLDKTVETIENYLSKKAEQKKEASER